MDQRAAGEPDWADPQTLRDHFDRHGSVPGVGSEDVMQMASNYALREHTERDDEILRQLIRRQEPSFDRYELFFLNGEGTELPDGSEATSGYVIDTQGRTFFFWTGWSDKQQKLELAVWKPVKEQPRWKRDAEYIQARAALGLFE